MVCEGLQNGECRGLATYFTCCIFLVHASSDKVNYLLGFYDQSLAEIDKVGPHPAQMIQGGSWIVLNRGTHKVAAVVVCLCVTLK